MPTDDRDLIEKIYQAMHGVITWQDWIDDLRGRFDGVKFAMWGHDLKARSHLGMLYSGYDHDYMNQWLQYYSSVNAWAPGLAAAPIGVTRTAEQLLNRDALVQTEYYQDWVRPQENIATGVGITLFSDASRFFGLTANVRLKDESEHVPDLNRLLTRIAPHLTRAFDTARRLPMIGNAETLETFVAGLPLATIAINRNGQYCYMNGLAQQFVVEWAEPSIDSNGYLHFSDPQANLLLSHAIQTIGSSLTKTLPHRTPIRLTQDGQNARLSIVPPPLKPGESVFTLAERFTPAAMVCLEAGAGQVQQRIIDALAMRYGLSPAEAALALALYSGETLRAAALRKGVSVHTVRNQLRMVFAKTQTHRQQDLVRLVSDLSARDGD